ncbi:unnamed protein product [Pleuronectes platessa]|uniref:Uncharacterized protein n=1 Tax=Pleuronectes platessa TaxID=8262 RepID=A0A9N7Y3F9_PLEPL|nr:unnamed protein product [Pleuronectes platessa]
MIFCYAFTPPLLLPPPPPLPILHHAAAAPPPHSSSSSSSSCTTLGREALKLLKHGHKSQPDQTLRCHRLHLPHLEKQGRESEFVREGKRRGWGKQERASCRWSPDVVALGTGHSGAVKGDSELPPPPFPSIAPPSLSVTGAIWPGRESGDAAESPTLPSVAPACHSAETRSPAPKRTYAAHAS